MMTLGIHRARGCLHGVDSQSRADEIAHGSGSAVTPGETRVLEGRRPAPGFGSEGDSMANGYRNQLLMGTAADGWVRDCATIDAAES